MSKIRCEDIIGLPLCFTCKKVYVVVLVEWMIKSNKLWSCIRDLLNFDTLENCLWSFRTWRVRRWFLLTKDITFSSVSVLCLLPMPTSCSYNVYICLVENHEFLVIIHYSIFITECCYQYRVYIILIEINCVYICIKEFITSNTV